MKKTERAQDTRDKIQLGGLIVKAGLREENKNILLGILIDAANRLHGNEADRVREHYQQLGDRAFSE